MSSLVALRLEFPQSSVSRLKSRDLWIANHMSYRNFSFCLPKSRKKIHLKFRFGGKRVFNLSVLFFQMVKSCLQNFRIPALLDSISQHIGILFSHLTSLPT